MFAHILRYPFFENSSEENIVNVELWIHCYLLAGQICLEQRNDRDLRAIYEKATNLCKSINEINMVRNFNLLKIVTMREQGIDNATIYQKLNISYKI